MEDKSEQKRHPSPGCSRRLQPTKPGSSLPPKNSRRETRTRVISNWQARVIEMNSRIFDRQQSRGRKTEFFVD